MRTSEDSPAIGDIIMAWADLWSAHDIDGLLRLHTQDVTFEDVARSAVFHGIAELRAYAEALFVGYPDVAFQLTSSFGSDHSGVAEWIMRATHLGDRPGLPATGKRVEVRGVSVFEFVNGKISRCSDYWDMSTVLKQLGLPSGS